jgi:hypothetical protein
MRTLALAGVIIASAPAGVLAEATEDGVRFRARVDLVTP